jgi:small-conductance mechanosensitive channel
MVEPLESDRRPDDALGVITRRFEPGLTLVVGLVATAAVVLGHAFSRLPSAQLARGGFDSDVIAELVVGIVLAILATAAWMAEGARRSSGHVVFTRVIVVSLLVGAAITGAAALVTEATRGCLGACG